MRAMIGNYTHIYQMIPDTATNCNLITNIPHGISSTMS